MKITIESTEQMHELLVDRAKVPARLWQGKTESGIPVHCFVTLIAAPQSEDLGQFERELRAHAPPREAFKSIPFRMVL